MGDLSRGLAPYFILVFVVGTAFGSALPEFGNLVAARLGLWAHFFNTHFLALGLVGLGVALYLGYTRCG
jgi:hypothetical protein